MDDTSSLNGMLHAISQCWKICVRLPAIIKISEMKISDIARGMNMSYKVFRRKLTTNDFSPYEMFQILSLIKANNHLANDINYGKNDPFTVDDEIASYTQYRSLHFFSNNSPMCDEAISSNLREAFNEEHFWFTYIIDHLDFNNPEEMILKARTHSVIKRMEWLKEFRGCSEATLYRIFRYQVLINRIQYSTALIKIDSEKDFSNSLADSVKLPCLNLRRDILI